MCWQGGKSQAFRITTCEVNIGLGRQLANPIEALRKCAKTHSRMRMTFPQPAHGISNKVCILLLLSLSNGTLGANKPVVRSPPSVRSGDFFVRLATAQGLSDHRLCYFDVDMRPLHFTRTSFRTICNGSLLKQVLEHKRRAGTIVGICARIIVSCLRSAHARGAGKGACERAIHCAFHSGGHFLPLIIFASFCFTQDRYFKRAWLPKWSPAVILQGLVSRKQ